MQALQLTVDERERVLLFLMRLVVEIITMLMSNETEKDEFLLEP